MVFLTFRPDPDAPGATRIGDDPEPPPIPPWAKALTAVIVVGGLFVVLNQEPAKHAIEITSVRGE
jgi:hypothetical protein